MSLLWFVAATALASYGCTWAVRRYALAHQLLDVPNERSSHKTATARGGGIAIALTFLALLAIFALLDGVKESLLWSILGGGAAVAAVGFVDDHRHLSPLVRLVVHFLAASWAVAVIVMGSAALNHVHAALLCLLLGAAVVSTVWLLNLYNFMDGIDAIASIEAITVCVGGSLVFFIAEAETWSVPLLLAAAVSGFLCWNYPPARIFMGDSGSGFLGFVLAVFCLEAASLGLKFFVAWIILLGVFIVDSGVALARRLLRGERLHEAHRSHGYQYAARMHGSHAQVSLAVGVVNVVWLLPIAALVTLSTLDWRLGLIIAYGPLFILACKYRSGASELRAS